MARDTIFEDMENNVDNDPASAIDGKTASYILKLKKTSRRFTTFIDENDKIVIRFGAGISDNPDEEVIPNPTSVGSSLPGSPTYLTEAFDPSNFLKTRTFGLAPSNTTLSIQYAFGGGLDDNVNSGDVTDISSVSYEINDSLLSATLVQDSKNSVGIF